MYVYDFIIYESLASTHFLWRPHTSFYDFDITPCSAIATAW